ncbi:hypothetical protein CSUI_001649, partial [Cystoisospora suis]
SFLSSSSSSCRPVEKVRPRQEGDSISFNEKRKKRQINKPINATRRQELLLRNVLSFLSSPTT